MQVSTRGSGRRITLLIVVLLISCYLADWSDDTCTSAVASRSTAFARANRKASVFEGSGGRGMNSRLMLAGLARMNLSLDKERRSALEVVFGPPWLTAQGTSTQPQAARLNSMFGDSSSEDFGISSGNNSQTNRNSYGLGANRSPYGSSGYGAAGGGLMGGGLSGYGSSSSFGSYSSSSSVSPY